MVYIGSDAGVNVDLGPGGVNKGGHAEGDILTSIENVYGSMLNDVITGDIGDNHLLGNQGNDHLMGRGGADTLAGGVGNDALDGGAGNDFLMGGQGADNLMGGMGDDTLQGGMGADDIDGGAGGMDVLRYVGSPMGVTVNLATGMASGGHADGDSIMNVEKVIGSNMGDMLTAHDSGSQLLGYKGNDTLMGGMGDDTLGGGQGTDMIDAGAGSNTLMGGMGADTYVLWTGVGEVTNKVAFAAGDKIKFGAAAEGETEKLTGEQVDAILDSMKPVPDAEGGGLQLHARQGDDHHADRARGVELLRRNGLPAAAERTQSGRPGPTTDNTWPGAGDDNSEADHIRGKGGDDDTLRRTG